MGSAVVTFGRSLLTVGNSLFPSFPLGEGAVSKNPLPILFLTPDGSTLGSTYIFINLPCLWVPIPLFHPLQYWSAKRGGLLSPSLSFWCLRHQTYRLCARDNMASKAAVSLILLGTSALLLDGGEY